MSACESLLYLPLVYCPKETFPDVVPRIIHVYHSEPLQARVIEGIVSHAPHFSFHTYDNHKAEQFLSHYFDPIVVERFREMGDAVRVRLLWFGLLYIHGGKCMSSDSILDGDPDLVDLEFQDRPRRARWLREMRSIVSCGR
jgi:hypothetical protein